MILGREVLPDVPNPEQQDGEKIESANCSDGSKNDEDIDTHQAAPPSCIQRGR